MHKGLRCIEIKTEIYFFVLAYIAVGSKISLDYKVYTGMNILELVLAALYSLRTCHKNPLTVYFKKVGAFPHIAKSCHSLKSSDVLPILQILRFKNKNLSLILHGSCTECHIVFVFIFKYLRVSYMKSKSLRIIFIVHYYIS